MPYSGTCTVLAISAVSSVLGFCVYYDKKRREDPDYKRKVRTRRLNAKLAKEQKQRAATVAAMAQAPQAPAQALSGLVRPNTEQYFLEQIHLGELRILAGDIETGITHMINATRVCIRLQTFLNMLESTLSEEVFSMFMLKMLQAEQARNNSNSIMPNVASPRYGLAW
ncbi:mitochondrial import receptor subunit TOM20 homolog [Drosophila madeirensis]|uniref:Mitochondrial import receptor subunit TOM20 homolog n=1 Tax=Drosophila madeirensis TaxID=30013 RepID=A0AAU9F3L7_DROMD